jgi:hypothetical protein
MESVASRTSNRIELRVTHSAVTSLDALLTVSTEGQAISFPVRTQLGMPLSVIVGDDNVFLHHGMLFIYDAGHVSRSPKSAKSTKKPTYGLIRYLSGIEVESEAQAQFDAKLYVPTEKYNTIWDMGARGLLPRQISLQVMGLQADAQWNIDDVGTMLLVEDFSFSFPVNTHGL